MKTFRPFALPFCLFFLVLQSYAQQTTGWGNGPMSFALSECLSEPARQEMKRLVRQNIDSLRKAGVLPQVYERNIVSFGWPLRQAAGYNDPGFYGISNYIDHQAGGGLQEYNCGARTYDGHKGTDIFNWPFPWTKVDEDAVEVIAGAPGTIVAKFDGNYSYNCSFTGDWNAVYVEHADGSVAWYGHMKEGSLTAKSVGQTVAQGEYLGVVASSGWSTGPHLHMEVYDVNDGLIDPWEGACNPTTPDSWWANQEPYYVSMINKISTHSQHPVMPQCYGTENPYFSNNFIQGGTVYCYAFLRDQLPGQQITFTIKRPNGTTYTTSNGAAGAYYPAAYWYLYFTLPGNAPLGTWTYSFTHNGVTLNHSFVVQSALPVELVSFRGEVSGENNLLRWTTASEINNRRFVVERSPDGSNFFAIGEVPGAGDANDTRSYEFLDKPDKPLSCYYRLLQEDFDGTTTYSPIVYINRQTKPELVVAPNPVRDRLSVQLLLPEQWSDAIRLTLADANGSIVREENFEPESSAVAWDWPAQHLPAGIYTLQIASQGMAETLVRKVVKTD